MNKIHDSLFKLVDLIIWFENGLKTFYHLNDHPYNCQEKIPKSSSIKIQNEVVSYSFHGIGCTFTTNDIEVNYSIYVNEKDYIVISPWGLMQFLNSNSNELKEKITQKEALEYLEYMEKDGLVKRYLDHHLIFQIDMSLYFQRKLNAT